ncbi:hypothetical protein ASF61_18320 [Duganella sp. Leaf126]|uniref:XrtB/PEP-CTERM-associated polysaccharide biosynthesis outer membrane protein EpsL n=1 Tax=Duganella sp. Leaf126 TaxID=1736266 RepID=UPI0006FFA381|nr:XrtB/PEP-CTERM-associated polysaccharide biosynthesis outer membrane protein EpsL [Duganella sp. Leaf126]KQQ46354.1 hypothetical protein ASF61_18320 [Duganella sp. Leaf126]
MVLPLLIGSLFTTHAAAQSQQDQRVDTFQPFVSTQVAYDSNLLRSDNTVDSNAAQSDTSKSLIAGLAFDHTYSRQHLTATVKATKVSFNRFNQLDYTGKDGRVDLNWNIAKTLSGNVGIKYNESLASFADFSASARNLRVQRKEYVNGFWRFHPSWRLRAGYTEEKFEFDLPSQAYNNRTEKTTEGGFDYLAPSGSTFGFLVRNIKGVYPTQVFGNGVTLDNGFKQDEAKINVNWNISGVSQLIFLGGYARRESNTSSLRNDSGSNGRLIVNWNPLSQVQFTGMLWREFGAAEGVVVNSALATGKGIDAKYSISSKIEAVASYRTERRAFKPLQGIQNLTGLDDVTDTASVGLTYQPTRILLLGLNAFGTKRDGSTAAQTRSFRAKGIAFNATVSF